MLVFLLFVIEDSWWYFGTYLLPIAFAATDRQAVQTMHAYGFLMHSAHSLAHACIESAIYIANKLLFSMQHAFRNYYGIYLRSVAGYFA